MPTPEQIETVYAALKRDTHDGLSGDEYSQGAYDTMRWLRGEQDCPFIYLGPPPESAPAHPPADPPLPADAWDPKVSWHTDADM